MEEAKLESRGSESLLRIEDNSSVMTKRNVETNVYSDVATIVEGQSGKGGADDIVILIGTKWDRPGNSL